MNKSTIITGLLLAITSFTIKLPYLGTFITIDERRWIHGAGQFLLALWSGNLAETYWHFHPGITITWGEAIILMLQNLAAPGMSLETFVTFQMDNLALSVGAMRLSGVILTSLAIPFLYAFARPLLGSWAALLGVGLVAVDPFWVAHSRVVNGDALAGILMPTAYLAFALLLKKPQLKWAVVSGTFVGLSLLTKLPSQILVPLIILLTAIGYLGHRNWQFWLKALVICGATAALVFVALWPAMWVAPVETLTRMYKDTFVVGDIGGKDKVDFFMGQVVESQSQWFYLPALAFRLTPMSMIGALLALGLLLWPDTPNKRQATGLILLFIIIVTVLANVSPKKADRYAMSVIVALDLLAGLGWVWFINKVAIRNSQSAIRSSLPLLLIAGQLLFTVASYPYILTYYNPLLGGYAKAAEIVPVGRGEGLEQAAAWINRQPDSNKAAIVAYYENVTNHYLAGRTMDWPKDGKKQLLADYVVFYITQTQRKLPYPGLVDYFRQQEPVYVVKHGDVPYVWVYKRQQSITPLAGEAEIVGRAQIVGYHQARAQLSVGSSTEFVLYFLTKDQSLPANENFKVSLLDGAGNAHGQWQSAPDNRWTTQGVVEWRGRLTLPDDLPPGDYNLKVSLVDTNIDAEVTFFPFEEELITVYQSDKVLDR